MTDGSGDADRVALVTGGGRGLGRAAALGLAQAGYHVALIARSGDELASTATAVRDAGVASLEISADVRVWDEVREAVRMALGLRGHIDVLVNAAGTSPYYKRSERLEPNEWDLVLETNLRGTFFLCRAVGEGMLERHRGAIINVSSVLGTNGTSRLAAYCASKGGIDALTRALAVEWAERGVRVNAVAPAFFETRLTESLLATDRAAALLGRTPMRRFGVPSEVAGAIVFLASDAASYITGSTIYVDGGWQAG